ncbi:MAG: hypothetical protein FJX35_12700 [Alphaproteobacteria bacterium]|nr:hypothetical protein [Alphaproteobacteria bacterium]
MAAGLISWLQHPKIPDAAHLFPIGQSVTDINETHDPHLRSWVAGATVNAGVKMHRLAGVKMHHG